MALYELLVKIVEVYKQELKITSHRGHTFSENLLSSDSIIVDFGAHLGDFSHELSRGIKCKCYAVEALPALYEKIPESSLVKKFNYAVTSSNNPVEFYISNQPESSSINSKVANFEDGSKGVVTVEGITLESFLKNNRIEMVDLLKLDIEGAEVEVFKSTSDDTLRQIKQITIEFHDFLDGMSIEEVRAIEDRLVNLGFFCIPFSYLFGGNNLDLLFINKKLCKISHKNWLKLHIINLLLRAEKTKYFILRRFRKDKLDNMNGNN